MPDSVRDLIECFKKLPGVGQKSAERMVFTILSDFDADDYDSFANSLKEVKENIRYCKNCNMITDQDVCMICQDNFRNKDTLIVTESVVPDMYLSCSMGEETIRFSMIDNALNGDITRSYIFTFDNVDDYNTYKNANENSSEVTYQNVTGVPSFDDANTTLTLTQTITKQELDSEENTTLPTAYGELRAYYVGEGYNCSIE